MSVLATLGSAGLDLLLSACLGSMQVLQWRVADEHFHAVLELLRFLLSMVTARFATVAEEAEEAASMSASASPSASEASVASRASSSASRFSSSSVVASDPSAAFVLLAASLAAAFLPSSFAFQRETSGSTSEQ